MTPALLNLRKFFSENYSIELSEKELQLINETVIISNQQPLQKIEERLCQTQRMNCAKAVGEALDRYYHPGMSLKEVKLIVDTVTQTKAELPNITETVRFLIVGD